MTNECNYFRRQIQSALNDGCLTLGDGQKMPLDVDSFPVYMINFEGKRVLVRTDQAKTTEGKNVVVSNLLRARMVKPHSLEVDVWKKNVSRKSCREWKLASSYLMEKYIRRCRENVFNRLSGYKRKRSPGRECEHRYRTAIGRMSSQKNQVGYLDRC
jgi:hypothetical protein